MQFNIEKWLKSWMQQRERGSFQACRLWSSSTLIFHDCGKFWSCSRVLSRFRRGASDKGTVLENLRIAHSMRAASSLSIWSSSIPWGLVEMPWSVKGWEKLWLMAKSRCRVRWKTGTRRGRSSLLVLSGTCISVEEKSRTSRIDDLLTAASFLGLFPPKRFERTDRVDDGLAVLSLMMLGWHERMLGRLLYEGDRDCCDIKIVSQTGEPDRTTRDEKATRAACGVQFCLIFLAAGSGPGL